MMMSHVFNCPMGPELASNPLHPLQTALLQGIFMPRVDKCNPLRRGYPRQFSHVTAPQGQKESTMRSNSCSKCDHTETCNPQPAITPADINSWPDLLNVEQLTQALGLRSRMVVYRMLEAGKLKGKRVGKSYVFTKTQVLQWLQTA